MQLHHILQWNITALSAWFPVCQHIIFYHELHVNVVFHHSDLSIFYSLVGCSHNYHRKYALQPHLEHQGDDGFWNINISTDSNHPDTASWKNAHLISPSTGSGFLNVHCKIKFKCKFWVRVWHSHLWGINIKITHVSIYNYAIYFSPYTTRQKFRGSVNLFHRSINQSKDPCKSRFWYSYSTYIQNIWCRQKCNF